MIQLLPNEQILTQSDEGVVTLTTHRIVYEISEWGRSYNQSIMLEHITSCENQYNSYPLLIILAGLCLAGGLIAVTDNNGETFGVAVFAGIIFAVLYLWTKSNLIVISSPSTQMKINANAMSRDIILGFLNKVEQAKSERVILLRRI